MSDELNITFDELMEEVGRYKHTHPNMIFITKEQSEFLIKAKQAGMSFRIITKLWNKMQDWPKLTESSIKRRYSKLSENE